MTITELKDVVQKQKAIGSDIALLNMVKPLGFQMKGLKVRTPFGLCVPVNYREYDDRVEIAIWVKVKQIEGFLKKVENAAQQA